MKKEVTFRITKALRDGEIPWHSTWHGFDIHCGFPTHLLSRQKYPLINSILLNLSASRRDYKSKYWASLIELEIAGTTLNPLEQLGTEIVNGNEFLTVYNLEQADSDLSLECLPVPVVKYEQADKLIAAINAKVKFQRTKKPCYYYPPKNYIEFPLREMFVEGAKGLPLYYEAMFHELSHWSEPRLKINEPSLIRELVADIVSNLICLELKIPCTHAMGNFRKYGSDWINLLESDHNLIFQVCELGEKVISFLSTFGGRDGLSD